MGTFSLFRPGEAYFLQFTPLLHEVDSVLHHVIQRRIPEFARFRSAMEEELRLLQKREKQSEFALLFEEIPRWIIVSDVIKPRESEKSEGEWEELFRNGVVTTKPKIAEEVIDLLWSTVKTELGIPIEEPKLLFRSEESIGVSQLLDSARGVENTLLVVATDCGDVIASFQEECWRYSANFYSSGTSAVIRCHKNDAWNVQWFPWSKLNSFCRVSTESGICVGVGNRHALLLSSDLKNGATGECSTYRCTPLCDLSEFGCSVVELWTCSTK